MTDHDTREKLEADLQALTESWHKYDGNYMRIYHSVAYAQIKELLDRQAAITARECREYAEKVWCDCDCCNWQEQRVEMQSKVDELQSQLDAYDETHMPLPKGSDGEPIHVGDWMERIEFSATMPEVARCVAVTEKEVLYKGKNRVGDAPSTVTKKAKASYWRRCLVNADGEVIRKGDFVWGKDGKKWLVTGFRWGHSHPVCVEDEYGHTKQLKPSWCSHTPPDSFKRIAEELREVNADTYMHSGLANLDRFADRIERLM